jgi:hypothetical protein
MRSLTFKRTRSQNSLLALKKIVLFQLLDTVSIFKNARKILHSKLRNLICKPYLYITVHFELLLKESGAINIR